jgi:ABC-2 type transport system permease protein
VNVLSSEWTKLRSVPSTAWSLLTAAVLTVGISAGYSLLRVTRPPSVSGSTSFDPIAISLTGVQLAQFAIAVLGVLVITGEYTTGLARSTFAAVPARLPVLWGKAVTLGLTAFAVCVPATIAAFLVGQSILAAENLDTTLGAPGATRAVIGGGLYLTGVAVMAVGAGALVRNTAGGISVMFGLLFGLQLISGMLPSTWSDHVYKYLPAPAGAAVTFTRPDPTALGPWTGLGVFCAYAVLLLALAAWRLRRRDV